MVNTLSAMSFFQLLFQLGDPVLQPHKPALETKQHFAFRVGQIAMAEVHPCCGAGLDWGADDYMVKPFELPELLARLRALMRRSQAATSAVLNFGCIELDTAGRRAGARARRVRQK